MSNLFKSKFLLGVMIVAVMLVGVFAVTADTSEAASCSAITITLKMGMRNSQVLCLQQMLNEKGYHVDGNGAGSAGLETTYFGPATLSAVKSFQAANLLVADGVFGPMSRAKLASIGFPTNLPLGCTSTAGFSSVTGQACNTGSVTYPAGCTSSIGFSPLTGASCATGQITNPVPGTGSGVMSVALSSDNPAAGTIVAGQAAADLAHFAFVGSGTVNSVMLKRTGISDQNTLANVYLYDGNTRLTDGYSFNTNGELTMNNLGIAVNGTRIISVKADVLSSTTSFSVKVSLTGYMIAGETAMRAANVMGNEMAVATGANLATAYLGANSVSSASVNAGTSAYTVWSAPLQINIRSVWLKGANFRIVGSAPSNALANARLYVDGVATGNAGTMTSITGSNYVTFDFSAAPVNLTTGSHIIDLRADIAGGSSYTVQLSVQNIADIVLYDPQVGVNIAILGPAGAAFSANNAGTITINAGSASVTVDPVFQALSNVTGGATNTVIGKFKVHGYGEDVKVSSLKVLPVFAGSPTLSSVTCTAGTDCSLNNVTVYFNGSQVGSQTNWTGSSASTLTFNLGSQMIIPAGIDSSIEVRADLQNASGFNYTGGTLRADLKQGTTNAQGQTSHSTLNFPGSDITGTTLTIQTGVLAVARNSGFANSSANPNTANVKIGSFTLQNQSSSESVRVTSLKVDLFTGAGVALDNSTTTPALNNFSNLKTSETSGSGATPIQPSASNTFSVDFTLAPGAVKTIDVFADTGAQAASATVMTKLTVTSIGSSSNVSVSQNSNGTAVTGQTITLATGTLTNPPTLNSTNSTAQQFVPAAGGAVGATKATFNIAATGGSATISELKFTVNSQDVSVAATGTNSTGSQTITPTTGTDANKFAVGDVVQLLGATGATGYGTVSTVTANTSLTVNITVVAGSTIATVRAVPATVTSIQVGSVSAPVVSGVAYLTGLGLTVPNGGSGLTQDVFISYAPVGTNGVVSGATSRVALEYVKYTTGGTTSTLCTTAMGSCSPSLATAVAAPTMKLVGSRPTLLLSASGSTLVIGTIDVGSVTVSASAKGDITLNALPLAVTNATGTTLSTAGNGVNGIIVKDATGNTVTTTNSGSFTTAGGTDTVLFTNGYQITAGTSQTFHIFLDYDAVGTAPAGSSTLSLGSADAFSWTDTAGSASAATGVDAVASAATTKSNKFKDGAAGTATPGFFFNYPTNTVNVNNN